MAGAVGRLVSFVGHVGGEIGFLLGTVGLLWLGAYLYELGYAARFSVPLANVDVGFPRPLLFLAAMGVGTAALASLVMIVAERAYPFIADFDARTVRRIVGGIALIGMIAILALVPERESSAWLEDGPLGLDLDPIGLALAGGLLVHAAALGGSWRRIARQRDWSILAAAALSLLIVAALPTWLGWWQAGRRMETGRSYLVLQEEPNYRLVRLYSSRAVFARWNDSTGRFDGGWRVERFEQEDTLLPRLTRLRAPERFRWHCRRGIAIFRRPDCGALHARSSCRPRRPCAARRGGFGRCACGGEPLRPCRLPTRQAGTA